MTKADFLVELGSEELPPKALKGLAEAFLRGIENGIKGAQLDYQSSQYFATPRRLAVWVQGLESAQQDQQIELLGPPLQAAYDGDGNPTKATQGFARKCGVDIAQLQQKDTGKGIKLAYQAIYNGQPASRLLPDIVKKSLNDLPIPKRMRWGESRIEFVRPVHWLVMLLGDAVVDCEILGLRASRESRGHRFHHDQPIQIPFPQQYQALLESPGHVLVDFDLRRDKIKQQAQQIGRNVQGHAVISSALLDEVTALVEWPVALAGQFDQEFLRLPREALVSSMAEHQKYFHVENAQGQLLPVFVTVSNIVSANEAAVIGGNERVIRPRLADAAFFYDTDCKTTLQTRLEQLKTIVFQTQLGTLYEKSERIAHLASNLAAQLETDQLTRDQTLRAGWLCKADLVTNMVKEFPDLQGIMGRYYATNDGEPDLVGQAICEHYLPRFSGDELPQSLQGSLVSIADKLDTICGLFAIGQPPSGDKDPFAIRRAALGILRIITRNKLDLDLRVCITRSVAGYGRLNLARPEELVETIFEFMLERFRAWFQDENISADVVQAVYARRPTRPLDFQKRVYAVNEFSSLHNARALASANKRVSNILLKQGITDTISEVCTHLLEESQEIELAAQVRQKAEQLGPLLQQSDYSKALTQLAELGPAVDAFFDHVMVMVEQSELRNNRLALLQNLRQLFLKVADISLLQF